MALIPFKPYTWLKRNLNPNNPGSIPLIYQYEANFVVYLSVKSLPASYNVVDSGSTKIVRIILANPTLPPGNYELATPIQLNLDPVSWENICIEIRDNTHGNPVLGKSTTHTSEADTSGGGMDEMLRPFFKIL